MPKISKTKSAPKLAHKTHEAPHVQEDAGAKKHPRTPQLVRGMKDILPYETPWWDLLYARVADIGVSYGFERIETPVVEETALFARSIGKDTDIVEKEMYAITDTEGEKLVLRPENTASIVRAYINHGMLNLTQPVKLWYWGPMFRHERPQSGRYRQFHQFGFEVLGDESPIVDAELILIAYNVYKNLGINTSIQINSIGCGKCRGAYHQSLIAYYRTVRHEMCENCRRRLQKNPLRALDCKEPQCQPLKKDAPHFVDYLCEPCKEHFLSVLEYLDELELPYFLNHSLVRGLDYYNRTVFELYAAGEEEGSQSALGGGGRYDGLAEILGGRPTPACGFAQGCERAILKMKEIEALKPPADIVHIFVAQIGNQAKSKALKLFENLRAAGITVAHNLSKNGLRPQLEIANKLGVRYSLVIGQKEVQDETVIIRDMESGGQESIGFNKAANDLKKKLGLS
ncbi:MAG: histidine--tRNA ligase [Candidatus Magasanikbacteria bacterium]|nr:histidine--tRNA ligase [Candidatus Magasanikbacteria bacterium]